MGRISRRMWWPCWIVGFTSLNGVVNRKGGPNLTILYMGLYTWNFPNFSRNLEWTLCWRTSWKEFCRNFRRRQTLHVSGASPESKFVCMTNTWRFCKRSLFLLLSRWPWENFNDRFNIHASLISKMLQRSSTSLSKNVFFSPSLHSKCLTTKHPMCNNHVFFRWTPAASIVWLTRKTTKSRHWGRPRPHRCDQRMDALGWKLRYRIIDGYVDMFTAYLQWIHWNMCVFC